MTGTVVDPLVGELSSRIDEVLELVGLGEVDRESRACFPNRGRAPDAQVAGHVDGRALVLRLAADVPAALRDKATRALDSYAEKCPAYQSVKRCIDCTWEAEIEDASGDKATVARGFITFEHNLI